MCHTIALIEGEHAAVTKMPENFTRWQGDNADRIEAAKDRGTLPSFLKDNPKTIKPVKTDAQKADIQARWDARKKANARTLKTAKNVFNAVKNFKDINFAKLQQYIKDGNLMAMKTETKAVAQAMVELQKKQRAISDIIPDVKNYNKQFTLQELEAVKVAVNKNIIFYEKLSLEEQKQKLEFEIDWLYQHKKYSTWEVSKAAYQRQLGKVEYKILNNEVDLLINTAKLLNAKSKSKLAGLLNNKEVSREYIEKVTAAVDALLKQRSKAIKGGLPNLTTREIAQLLDKYEKETIESADGRLRPWAKYVWNTLSLEEKNLLTKYTQTYNYLNEPLRGLPYYGSTIPNAAHVRDLPILTKALSKFKMPEHTIVRRGTDSWVIKELGYGLDKLKVGDVFTDKGFLSTAAHRTKGFSKKYHFIIVVPKGSQGFYAEPFSHYTDENKFTYADSPKHANLWNGQSKETIKSEMEWIGQRGSTFKVLKRQGNDIYLQLIGQLQ
jgi:hypothetical protein